MHTTCILIRRAKKELFVNALQTGGIWKRQLCLLVWTKNNFKTELFENGDIMIISVWFPCERFPKSKMTGDYCVFKLLRRSVNGDIWWIFRVKTPFSNYSGLVWTGPESTLSFIYKFCLWTWSKSFRNKSEDNEWLLQKKCRILGNRELKKTTTATATATATATSLNKRFNEQNNGCTRAL